MPLPMVHLAVAICVHEVKGTNPSPAFLLGSIAPDAIHMRPNVKRDAKQRVHLLGTHSPTHKRVREMLERHWAARSEIADFAEGYAAHLLTDRLWRETVIESFLKSIPQDLSAEEQRVLYYQETDQVDFNLYHQMPWRRQVWVRLAAAQPRDFLPLLTGEEIEQWRDRTLKWFEELKEEPRIEPVHITDEDVQVFIGQAGEMVTRCPTAWKATVIDQENQVLVV